MILNFRQIFLGGIINLCCLQSFCQSGEDSAMLMHSEKYAVKKNKGFFGLSKPNFGAYVTLDVSKTDSPPIVKKTKDSSYTNLEISGNGVGLDRGKMMTIKKTVFYKLSLAGLADTIQALFAISSVSHEKRQTFLSMMLSKSDEGKNAVLDYNRNIQGTIRYGNDSGAWMFFIDHFISGGRITENDFAPVASISGGYIKNEQDSLYTQMHSSFTADMVLVNAKGEHLAALAFKQRNPDIWIRNDIDLSYQKAIAALFAVIISIRDF